MKASISRHAHFNAAHRLHVKAWSDEKNAAFFGLCNNPHYHGHNYALIVTVHGEIDPVTGYVIDIQTLSEAIEKHVLIRLDHKNLNIEVEPFITLNPSAENIAVTIWQWLRPVISSELGIKVTLYETPRNFVEFDGI